LLNQLTGKDRAIVSPVAGTTRDSIDEVIRYKGRAIRFVDTAGIRRKGKTHLMAEKLSVVMARKNMKTPTLCSSWSMRPRAQRTGREYRGLRPRERTVGDHSGK